MPNYFATIHRLMRAECGHMNGSGGCTGVDHETFPRCSCSLEKFKPTPRARCLLAENTRCLWFEKEFLPRGRWVPGWPVETFDAYARDGWLSRPSWIPQPVPPKDTAAANDRECAECGGPREKNKTYCVHCQIKRRQAKRKVYNQRHWRKRHAIRAS